MEIDAREVVRLIESGNPEGLEKLYALVKNFTYFLMRQLGPSDLEDKVHDVFVAAATAISAGRLRDPEKLIPFLAATTRFYTYGQIGRRVVRRKYVTPLEHGNIPDSREKTLERLIHEEKIGLIKQRFERLPSGQREIVERFYILEQPKEQIESEMGLTPTQFRLRKSNALQELAANNKYKIAAIRNKYKIAAIRSGRRKPAC